jgi:uncharacterized protein YjiS (DUF1127 family)
MCQRIADTIRRSASGAVDTRYYMSAARRERARLLRTWIAERSAAVRRHWRRSAAYHVLNGLSDHELHDIGLCRCEIASVADGSYFGDASRRPRGGAGELHE